MEPRPRRIEIYVTPEGREPFEDWIGGLRDRIARAAIWSRLERIEDGNFGDHRPVGDGVLELRIAFGPGYRVYFGLDGTTLVLLLCGGDKSSQERDIQKAKAYWRDYLNKG